MSSTLPPASWFCALTSMPLIKPAFNGRILPIDEETAGICARLHIPDRAPENDSWIAATAKQYGLTLATRNVKDMRHAGIKLFDPFA